MKEFALIFRVENGPMPDLSPAELQERMTGWMNWMGGIAAKDRLVNNGSRLGIRGSKWLGAGGVVSDGPYTEIKEFINGYTIIRAESGEEAAELAKGCPILFAPGGSVEVRPLVAPDHAE
ncbi:MAG TPA: YciI family protein [Puia sp.]|nr:YciI family protein [Puia sp.]